MLTYGCMFVGCLSLARAWRPACRARVVRRVSLRARGVERVETGADTVRVFAISDLHADHAANLATVRAMARPPGDGYCALIVAGDVASERRRLGDALSALRRTYDAVFYVAGNHEAWVTARDRDDAIGDSVAKLAACEETAAAAGCRTAAATLVDAAGRSVTVAPLRSWYHASHDREPDLIDEPVEKRPFARRWADFRRCAWPAEAIGGRVAGASPRPHGLGDGDRALSRFYAASNPRLGDVGDALLTFSHFSPRRECVPEKRFLLEPGLAKTCGSDDLGKLVEDLAPAAHVSGHTHIPIDFDADGTYFLQWPLGSPREQRRQCHRVLENGPAPVFSTRGGVTRLGTPGALARTAWGDYYATHRRDPAATDLAPWVEAYRARRRAPVAAAAAAAAAAPPPRGAPPRAAYDADARPPAKPTVAGYDADMREEKATYRDDAAHASIAERLEGSN